MLLVYSKTDEQIERDTWMKKEVPQNVWINCNRLFSIISCWWFWQDAAVLDAWGFFKSGQIQKNKTEPLLTQTFLWRWGNCRNATHLEKPPLCYCKRSNNKVADKNLIVWLIQQSYLSLWWRETLKTCLFVLETGSQDLLRVRQARGEVRSFM